MNRRLALALLVIAGATTIWQAGGGAALGPVLGITPDEVDPGGLSGYVQDVDLSGRGEIVGVRDDEVSDTASIELDDAGTEPAEDGDGIGVSGDGCTFVTLLAESVRVVDRCTATDQAFALPSSNDEGDVTVTFDGRFAAFTRTQCAAACMTTVIRLDATSGQLVPLPVPAGYRVAGAEFNVDIDDSGDQVVVSLTDSKTTILARWTVSSGAVTALTDEGTGLWSAFPSVSGDGRFVAFASNQPRGLGEAGEGPWVYVLDTASGVATLVSEPDGHAYFTSLTRDATQVAFAVGVHLDELVGEGPAALQALMIAPPPGCVDPVQFGLWNLESQCPPVRIDVAYGPSPGLADRFEVEQLSLAPDGSQVGQHRTPVLSGNGRWIGWITDVADQLVADPADRFGYQAVRRRRDPNLQIDSVSFAAVLLGGASNASTVVRNTGRTSVWLDEIVPEPAEFAVIGGTCAVGVSLPPGGTCTVDLRFTPSAAGAAAGTLRVGETGFDPVTATAPLDGAGVATTTTSTTTTIAPPVITPIPTPPTTTTRPPVVVPGAPSLSANPTSIDFGDTPVALASDAHTVTVRNGGTASGVIATTLSGPHPDDFWVRTNGCNATTLTVGAQCSIEVLFVPRDGGPRSATLTVRSGASVVTVSLGGNGTFDPRLIPSPSMVTTRGVSVVYGVGFPPGDTFTVVVLGTDVTLEGTADATGVFRAPLEAAGVLPLGAYTLHVDGVADTFDAVEAPFLVGLATFAPQGASGPAFGSTNIIVARGG